MIVAVVLAGALTSQHSSVVPLEHRTLIRCA